MSNPTGSILSLSPETLSDICNYLVDHEAWNNRQRGKHLVPLLTICSTLYRPAVAVLWNTIFNLNPLLYTLPSSLCMNTKVDSSHPRLIGRKSPLVSVKHLSWHLPEVLWY